MASLLEDEALKPVFNKRVSENVLAARLFHCQQKDSWTPAGHLLDLQLRDQLRSEVTCSPKSPRLSSTPEDRVRTV